jgi:hypothetical protein
MKPGRFSFTQEQKFFFLTQKISDGQDGCGKTMTLSHILHYCYLKEWLILLLPSGEYMIQFKVTS